MPVGSLFNQDGTFRANLSGLYSYPDSRHWFINAEDFWFNRPSWLETVASDGFHFGFSMTVLQWGRQQYWHAPVTAVVYCFIIWAGVRIMKNRPAFGLRSQLKYWNLFLALFSVLGSIRLVPHMTYLIWNHGVRTTVCAPPAYSIGDGATSIWVILFMLSKYAELIDTGFIVLRKKHLSFLHWYHHATVLAYTWDATLREQGVGVLYCVMNYSVHAVMYFYYYLAASGRPPKWGVAVTILQISQMFFGIGLTSYGLWLSNNYAHSNFWTHDMALSPTAHGQCFVDRRNLLGACVMYLTYFYLFADFFVKKYILKQPSIVEKPRIVPNDMAKIADKKLK